jgi:hypothetical protein
MLWWRHELPANSCIHTFSHDGSVLEEACNYYVVQNYKSPHTCKNSAGDVRSVRPGRPSVANPGHMLLLIRESEVVRVVNTHVCMQH